MRGIDLSCQPGPGTRAVRAGGRSPTREGQATPYRVVGRPHQESRRRRLRQQPVIAPSDKWWSTAYLNERPCMCVCKCLYMCIRIYVCARARVYRMRRVRVCTWTRVCTYACVGACNISLPLSSVRYTQLSGNAQLHHIVTFLVGHYCLKFHNFTKKKKYVIPN